MRIYLYCNVKERTCKIKNNVQRELFCTCVCAREREKSTKTFREHTKVLTVVFLVDKIVILIFFFILYCIFHFSIFTTSKHFFQHTKKRSYFDLTDLRYGRILFPSMLSFSHPLHTVMEKGQRECWLGIKVYRGEKLVSRRSYVIGQEIISGIQQDTKYQYSANEHMEAKDLIIQQMENHPA